MATLEKDLEKYWDESYKKGDVKAGLKLLGEVLGIISVGSFAATALFVWIPGIGIPITGLMATRLLMEAAKAYSQLDKEERRQIRSVVRWINGGISVLD